MTNTTHRPKCTRPGWTTEPSRSITGITIAHCTGCDAIELRHDEPPREAGLMEAAPAGGPHGRAAVTASVGGGWSA